MLRSAAFFICVGLLPVFAAGQQTLAYAEPNATYTKAINLYNAHRYSAAEHLFEQVSNALPQSQSTDKIDADYYAAVCSMYLFHDDAERRMTGFITEHPQSPRVHKINFLLGNYAYLRRNFKEAIAWYNKADPSYLDNTEASEYYFKRGYAYFHENKTDSAKLNFFKVKDAGSKYSPAATYYYSYIAYKQKNYETAIMGFLSLKNDMRFGDVVPYYITELYYLEGDYDNAVKYAIPLIDSAKNASSLINASGILRLAAESYYRMDLYSKAVTYFNKYANGSSLPEQESYELGYSYFASKQFKAAIPWLQGATYNNDSLAQNAYYYLAVCYLKTNNKLFASNAFKEAYTMNFNTKLKEDALFNYAKLTYEISFDPFDGAIKAFNKYLKEYPNSSHKEEVYRYLLNVYRSTKNYPAALASLEQIKQWTPDLQAIYQKLTYFRGVDMFNNHKPDSAIAYFNRSLKYNYAQKLNLLAYYWKAEALYREKKYTDAIEAYKLFMVQPQAFSSPLYNMAEYGIGYAYFEMKNYQYSSVYFRKYTDAETADKKRLSDALNRAGDCYFIQADYASAIPYYDKNIQLNTYDMDYAAYQKAMSLGVLQKFDDKITTLQAFMTAYPKSSYRPSAMMELANTYAIDNKPTQAISEYSQVLANYPNSPYTVTCLLQKGQIYFNLNQNDSARSAWQQVVKTDRNSPEGAEALSHLKSLYTAQGQIQQMQDYFHSVGADLSQMALDSATFSIVKSDYLNNNYTQTLQKATIYLKKYPQGIFSTEVHFYRGEAYYSMQKNDSALADYSYVAKMPKSFFTESALAKAAAIAFGKKEYVAALTYYTQLSGMAQYSTNVSDALTGKMRCEYQLKKYDSALAAAQVVLKTAKIQPEVYAEATFDIAKALFAKEQYDSALTAFEKVTAMTHSEIEAEAKYNVAYIQYLKGNTELSEKTIFDLVNQEPSYPEWMAKALILLANNYLAVNDDFEAKNTLKTVAQNASDTALVGEANRKIEQINEKEKKPLPPPVQQNMTIPFNNNNAYNKLFKQ